MKDESEIRDVQIVSSVPVIRERSGVLLMPVMDLNTAKARLLEFEQFCAHYLGESLDGGNDGGDYGVIPGTKKRTLLKSGSDKLCELYGLYDEYQVLSTVEDWDKGLFDYTLKCILKSRRDDSMVGAGVGSCSSWESKYRWRDAKRTCPVCGNATIIKGQEKFGGGYICWKKEGRSDGCGAKFRDDDKSIIDQPIGRIENPDIIDAKNTVLKMAKKRAKIDAVIGVTRSSGIFTQDMDDVPMPPPKPTVERTTEDIPLVVKVVPHSQDDGIPPAEAAKGGTIEREAQPENFYESTKRKVAEMQSAPVDEPVYPGCIDKGMKANFARSWSQAAPKGMKAAEVERARKEWLARHNYIGDDGVGTAGKIPLKDFDAVKADGIAFVKGLK